jgi:hypothetical protein
MSSAPSPGTPASATGSTAPIATNEDDLRGLVVSALQNLNRREPLDATYKRLLLSNTLTRRSPVIPKDKFYKRIRARLRERVEVYMTEMQGKDPFDRISQRKPLEEAAMRSAFNMRESKEHEQVPLLEATVAAQAMDPERKRHLDGIALGLQSRKEKKLKLGGTPKSIMEQTEHARQKAELDRQRAQARKWEDARRQRESEERRQKEEELNRKRGQAETPQQALHKIIEPVFKKLWDMEFANLGGTNPFRIVIDRENCAAIGASDYCDIITTPMNLSYIQQKVNKVSYTTLQSFFSDVDLMITNAVTYNSDPGNPYRLAAEEMKKRHDKIVRKVWQQIQKRQQQS